MKREDLLKLVHVDGIGRVDLDEVAHLITRFDTTTFVVGLATGLVIGVPVGWVFL